MTEDLAETLALAASEPFAERIRQELDTEQIASTGNLKCCRRRP